VTVLAILIGIALPSFAAAGDRASTRAAEVDLHTAASAALILATEAGGTFVNGDGTTLTPADLHDEEPSLAFAAEAADGVIGVEIEDDDTTLHLTKYDRNGELVELVVDAARKVVSDGDDDEDEDDSGNGNGNGNGGSSGGHRQDGDQRSGNSR
jgi:type II secretory pathway pseudopilin PulG